MAVNILIAFLGGFLAFISPCVLPLIPIYIAYISGVSVKELESSKKPFMKTLSNSLFFVLGFTIIFTLLGILFYFLASGLGEHKIWLSRIGGAILVIFGLQIAGLINIPFLNFSAQASGGKKNATVWSSFVMGLVFGAGWTPCVGPILAGILFSATAGDQSMLGSAGLLAIFSLGLGIPFILTGMLTQSLLSVLGFLKKHARVVEWVSGGFLVVLGLLLTFGALERLATLGGSGSDLEIRLMDQSGPNLRIKSPVDGEVIEGDEFDLVIRMSDESGVETLYIVSDSESLEVLQPTSPMTNVLSVGADYLIYADDVKGQRSDTNFLSVEENGSVRLN